MVKDFAGNKDYIQKLNAIEHSREAYVKGHNTPPGVPTQKGLTGDVEFISEAYPVVEFGNYDIPEGWENALAKPTQTGVPAQWENPNTTGFESDGEEETNLYFFHTDHLGSTNYLTDKDGVVQQSIVYQPYGEVLYEEKTYSNPYKFNGKELDTETGLAYYGARYYSPELGIWYGVDPLMEKYPAFSPYVFCAGNPVKYIDPDGEAWKPTFETTVSDENCVNMQQRCTGFEWISEDNSYESDGTLKKGLYNQAIFFSNNGTFDSESKYNIGSSTATLYKSDGTTETFDACTNPSDPNKYATVPEGLYVAFKGFHKGNTNHPALRVRDLYASSQTINLRKKNPAFKDGRTYASGINIHKPGFNNITGIDSKGFAISEGCLLIDRANYSDFMDNFSSTDRIGVAVSRSMSAPTNRNTFNIISSKKDYFNFNSFNFR